MMNKIRQHIFSNSYVLFWVICISLALFLRLINLGNLSLRLDEAQSVWQASHSLNFIREYMLKNVHLPLHNSLLHVWMHFFGSSEYSVRMMALIPGILSIPALYMLSKEILGAYRSRLTALFGAISPIWVWYSREIRMYTMLTLVSILSYYFFLKITKTNKFKFYLGYLLVNIIGIYTHYFFSLVMLVQLIYLFANFTYKDPKFKNIFISWIVFGSAFVPWIWMVLKNYGSGTLAPSLAKPNPFNIVLSYFEFTNGFLPEEITGVMIAVWPLLILLAFIYLTKRQNPFNKEMLLVVLGTFLPVYIIYNASVFIKPMYLTRYLITATPMYYILLSWYFNELTGKKRNLIIGMFLISIGYSLFVQFTHVDTPVKENYKDAITFIEQQAGLRDVVAVSPPYTIYPFNYYYDGNSKVSTLPIWDKRKGGIPDITTSLLESNLLELKKNHSKLYLLSTLDLEGANEVKSYVESNFKKIEKHKFSKYVYVEVYDVSY